MNRVDQELRGLRKNIWRQQIKKSKFAIGLVLMIAITLSWNIYRSADKLMAQETLFGVLVGLHQVQGNLGSSTTMLAIKLNNGESVLVTAPVNLLIRDGAEVKIIRGKTKHGSVYYYFSGYKEQK